MRALGQGGGKLKRPNKKPDGLVTGEADSWDKIHREEISGINAEKTWLVICIVHANTKTQRLSKCTIDTHNTITVVSAS